MTGTRAVPTEKSLFSHCFITGILKYSPLQGIVRAWLEQAGK